MTWTKGSAFDIFIKPETNFGKSAGFFALTATLTTGDTEYFIERIVWAWAEVDIVPCFNIASSTPTNEQVLPHGTSTTSSAFLPIIKTTLWIVLMCKSTCLPGL